MEGLGHLLVRLRTEVDLEVVEDTRLHVLLGAQGFLQETTFFEVLPIEEIHLFFLFVVIVICHFQLFLLFLSSFNLFNLLNLLFSLSLFLVYLLQILLELIQID